MASSRKRSSVRKKFGVNCGYRSHIEGRDAAILPLQVHDVGWSIWPRNRWISRENPWLAGIELVVAGGVVLHQFGQTLHVKAGEAFVKYLHIPHRYETGPEGFARKRYLQLKGPAIQPIFQTAFGFQSVLSLADTSSFLQAHRCLCRLLRDCPTGFETTASALAYELVINLAAEAGSVMLPDSVKLAIAFMDGNLHRRFTNGEICRSAGLSATRLHEVFVAAMGMTAMQYAHKQRMEVARSRLAYTEERVSRIAFGLGFEDPQYFSRKFFTEFGMSPSAYRSRALGLGDLLPREYEGRNRPTQQHISGT